MLQFLETPLHFITAPLQRTDLLGEIDETLVLHNAFDGLQTSFKLIQLDQDRVLGGLHQGAAADNQR